MKASPMNKAETDAALLKRDLADCPFDWAALGWIMIGEAAP